MASRNKGRKTYRTMQGKVVDLDLLIKRNELTPAVGNAKVNARGDELGPGGKIIRKREEVIKDYYKGNAPVMHENAAELTAAEKEELDDFDDEPVVPKATVAAQKHNTVATQKTTTQSEWVEDEDGNFVAKED